MTIALSTRMKLGILTGIHKKPKPNSKYLPHWNRCNDMLISLNTVSPDIRSSIVYCSTAKCMWEQLQTKHTRQCSSVVSS